MAEVQRVRLRSGALAWRLYEDVAYPERFAEIWVMESWTAGQASIRSCRDALSRTPGRIIGSVESSPSRLARGSMGLQRVRVYPG